MVYVNDMSVSDGFSVEHLGGAVRFLAPLPEGAAVTVSGKSIKVDQAGGFFNWSAELAADTADITTFESEGSRITYENPRPDALESPQNP
ncbi:MAG: hypothetical protein DDT21_02066 [Syntrophomonadaceae bacterium]|nr:hypothetical protein [Bacillota bacterium]